MNKLPLHTNIAAVVPHYGEQGDYTMIITNTGKNIYYPYRLRTILQHIAYELALDLAAIKKHAAKATHQAILQPLPLAPKLLLVPVKVRIPSESGQPSIGYVNYYSIATILEKSQTPPYRSNIELYGGCILPIIWTSTTIKKQLRYAKLALTERYPSPLLQHEHAKANLRPLAQKLVELIYDILLLKQN